MFGWALVMKTKGDVALAEGETFFENKQPP
jgi:hypothetical protein